MKIEEHIIQRRVVRDVLVMRILATYSRPGVAFIQPVGFQLHGAPCFPKARLSMALETILIECAGSVTSRSPKGPNTTTPFVIEVETSKGPAYLQIGPQPSAVLAEELASYLKRYEHE